MFCLPYSLALPKHSIHLRQGSLWLREMCFVRLLFVLSSIVLHFRSIPCIRSGDLFHSLARPKHSMHPRQGSLSCTAVFRPFCSVLSSIDSLALPKPCSCNAFCEISAVARCSAKASEAFDASEAGISVSAAAARRGSCCLIPL